MSCADVPSWYLRHHVAVLDLASATWQRARPEVLPPGYEPDVCMRRLAAAGRLRRLRRGAYLVVDPVREVPPIVIASALFSDVPHYVTTDVALAFHGLIDQPILDVIVVLNRRGRPVDIGSATVRPVAIAGRWFQVADAYATTVDGFPVRVASREQAVVDALAEPAWMTHGSLLPEVLGAFSGDELERTANRAVARSTAAGQRLGYLLEGSGHRLPTALAVLRPVRAVRLRPASSSAGPYSTRWRVYG